ncbi:hypothetical protein E2C01_082066 [Portunus trituberculatus]|uniref:Uncharacterized protein n=1 Tax=Portunus trituberculatus TaxID=210409 RepID=A0A5B7IRE1_PORTR|nr:hypothetical protein [Portunus trituberculatus]
MVVEAEEGPPTPLEAVQVYVPSRLHARGEVGAVVAPGDGRWGIAIRHTFQGYSGAFQHLPYRLSHAPHLPRVTGKKAKKLVR